MRAYIQRLDQRPRAKPAAARRARLRPNRLPEQIDFSKWGPVTKKPMTPLRKVIAGGWRKAGTPFRASRNSTRRISRASASCARNTRRLTKRKARELTLTPFVLKAVVGDVEETSDFQLQPGRSGERNHPQGILSIGIAVDTEQGLIVPVIRDVDKKAMLDLSKELEQLAAKARDRKISAEELKGGTFTISNQGGIGGAHFTPIVNKPEVAILGLGRGAMKPVVRDGKIETRMMHAAGVDLRSSRH